MDIPIKDFRKFVEEQAVDAVNYRVDGYYGGFDLKDFPLNCLDWVKVEQAFLDYGARIDWESGVVHVPENEDGYVIWPREGKE